MPHTIADGLNTLSVKANCFVGWMELNGFGNIELMKNLEPAPDIAWIYDVSHSDYHSETAEWLRQRRAKALAGIPVWAKWDARAKQLLQEVEPLQTKVTRRT